MRRHGARQAVDPELDAVVERELGVLAQVLDRALELAGVALGAELGGQLRVDDATRPSSWATAVPGRGVARISTSSAASVTPAERHRAVGVELDLVPRGPPP